MTGASRRALILLVLLGCACHAWRPVPLAPQASVELPAGSLVVLRAGARVQVRQARASADSIVGVDRDGKRFAVSRDSVALVQERRVSTARTIGLVGAIGVGLLSAFTALVVAAGPGLPADY